MDDLYIQIDEDSNVIVKDQYFWGTPGLWQLIMFYVPRDYVKEDAEIYADLVVVTQVIFNPLTKSEKDKPESTKKYTGF